MIMLTDIDMRIQSRKSNDFQKYFKQPGRLSQGGLRTKGYLKTSQEEKPLISIITVVFNGEKYLEETIQSVITQTYDNIEYIIIDGGSTDSTLDILRNYEDRIDYWVSEKDNGIYDAMNKGIDLATGDWLLFIGADDKIFSPQTISSIPFEKYKHSMLIAGKIVYDTQQEVTSSIGLKTLFHNTVHHQSAFYSKNLFTVWRYDLSFDLIADYELNLLLYLTQSQTTMVNELIAFCQEGGISRKHIKIAYQETNAIRKKHLGKRSVFFTVLYSLKMLLSLMKKNTFYATK